MSQNVAITLNGQEIQVSADATIREVAKAQGVHIPTFCYDDRLKPFASCFLCVVEVEKARGLLPACSTKVTAGMVIHTDSEKVTATRKQALNLLLSDHAGDCIAPCEATCPANIDIQGYIAHIANGHFESAVRLIKERNPLPVVCGRICPHPCESQCRRGLVDEPVAINPLKRFASEFELEQGPFVTPPGASTGKKLAIVGGGPAGLSAAYYSRLLGHEVHLFEALPKLGGMARYGIPRFRLPWEKMDREIQAILDMGVTVHYSQRLGQDFTLADLKAKGFGAILLAIGAHQAKPMRIKNEESPGVIGGVDFLRKVVLGEDVEMGKRVAVLGGGDTAMDCARVARRLGGDVTILYRRTQAEMPALPQEQEETIEEGVDIRYLTAPVEVLLDDNGRACGLRVITMELGEPDESGRRRPVPKVGSEEDLEFDLIVAAIGQDPDVSCIQGEKVKPETTKWRTFVYDEKTQVTSMEGVFAAGDCSFGPDILIRAIGEGRRAALAMDLHLKGARVELKAPYAISRGRLEELEMADFSPRYVHKKRALETTLHAPERLNNDGGWGAINVGLDQVKAMAEATRCIECGCNARFDCDLRRYATDYGADEKKLAGAKRSYEEDKRHPLIRIESDKCITCGSCVRVCSEVRGIHALTFINRGFVTKVGPNFGDALQDTGCDACGMCTDLCPTGTLSSNTGKECGPWKWQTTITTCTGCSLGCALQVRTNGDQVVEVRSLEGDPVNGACICAEGRFSYRLLAETVDGDANAALTKAKERVFAARKVGVVVSPFRTVEEIYAAALLARQYDGTLHYVPAASAGKAGKPRGKIAQEANVALLEKLGATPMSA
ncbi:MAG: FAD-dependent oxidoreductase, partial [Magnetococcales bacterium]|nr:FAD-dependent oxidoreductase [Magnetococcales bacterium]